MTPNATREAYGLSRTTFILGSLRSRKIVKQSDPLLTSKAHDIYAQQTDVAAIL